jgi:hypothetical protein
LASTDAILGLSLIIIPIVILVAGWAALHFIPSKRRVISILLILVGGVSTAFYGIGFLAVMTRDEASAGLIGLGLMVALGLVTLFFGLINLRKKPAKDMAVQQTA